MTFEPKKITALIHAPYDDPGYITSWIKTRKIPYREVNLWKNDTFPEPDSVRLLVIMGGLMNIYQDILYPWLTDEKDYITEIIRRRIPVLGICLGGQLMCHCLGGEVTTLPRPEYGWCEITRSNLSEEYSNLSELLPERLTVFQWHQDTFSIPLGATPLYSSGMCKNQGFILDDLFIGLQFHPEMEKEPIIKFIDLIDKSEDICDKIYSREDILMRIGTYSEGNLFISLILEYLLSEKRTNYQN